MKPTSTFLRISVGLWVMIFLISLPNSSFASQRSDTDSVLVLAITYNKLSTSETASFEAPPQIRKVSYIAVGARINLLLKDGKSYKQVYIKNIHRDRIKITGNEYIPLSAIKQIKVGDVWRRTVTRLLGGIALGIGIISTFGIISFAMNLASGSALALLLFWIPGMLLVLNFTNKYPTVNINRSNIMLNTVSMSSLTSKIRKKLFSRTRFYHKRLK